MYAELQYLSGYYALTAQSKAEARRSGLRKLVRHSDLREAVVDRLKTGWTPEQIAGRLRRDGNAVRVSHETIYPFVYSKDGHAIDLWHHLPEHHRRRRGRGKRRAQVHRFADELSIRNRPVVVAARKEFGHWEGGLIQFRKELGPGNVTSLVERVSRFTLLLKNADRKSKPVMEMMISDLFPLPFQARRSITFDRGFEFLAWPQLQAGLGVATWYCDPRAPWQKGPTRTPMAAPAATCPEIPTQPH